MVHSRHHITTNTKKNSLLPEIWVLSGVLGIIITVIAIVITIITKASYSKS